MAELKFKLNKNDYVSPKKSPADMHFVIKIDLHRVYLRRESDDHLFELPKRMLNLAWQKVDPKVVKVLYEEMANNINTNDKPSSSSE